ncbi:MAG: hypothetical protein DI538_09540 [Azospira oryzae]|jgi:hypothetical protein|nr:MAG: hypothetical protein DI538_09540 [Azospira oryzae]
MKKQNYSNHVRYYPPHHFVLLPLLFILTVWSVINIFYDSSNQLLWIFLSLLSAGVLFTALLLRQHYALGNQNRIVRLEFRLRHFELLGVSSQKAEAQLSFSQIAALRFADDSEFIQLLDRALKENLPAKEIKKSIRNWQGDYMRV